MDHLPFAGIQCLIFKAERARIAEWAYTNQYIYQNYFVVLYYIRPSTTTGTDKNHRTK